MFPNLCNWLFYGYWMEPKANVLNIILVSGHTLTVTIHSKTVEGAIVPLCTLYETV